MTSHCPAPTWLLALGSAALVACSPTPAPQPQPAAGRAGAAGITPRAPERESPALAHWLQPAGARIRLAALRLTDRLGSSSGTPGVAQPGEAPQPELLEHCDAPRSVVVRKAARQIELRCGGELAARHTVGLGFTPLGDKHHEGDGRTPEGRYFITGKLPSRFHRSLQLSYPNAEDAARGLSEGQITREQHDAIVRALSACRRPPQTTALGSLLQIHGGGSGGDWTLGCVALDNPAIEQLFAFHRPGCLVDGTPRTPVDILP